MAYGTKHQTKDGVKLIGSNLYGTCSTSAGTAQKVVDLDGFDVLVTGVTIHVKFDSYNYASNPTLKVGSTAARPIRRNGSSYGQWESGAVVSFTYDGSYWQQNDFYDTDSDSNTTYTLSGNGTDSITLTGSNGYTKTVYVSPEGDTYTLSRSGRTVTLKRNNTDVSSVTIPTVTTRVLERSVNISGGDYVTKEWTPDTLSNFTPIGLVGYEISGSNSHNCSVWSAYFNASRLAYMQIQNNGSGQATLTVRMRILYAPD